MSVTTLGRTGLVAAIGLGLSVVASTAGVAGRAATVRTGVIHAGHARFEVLSPTLIRVEYSTRDDFENRPTVVAQDRTPTPAYTVTRRHDRLVITTTSLRLRYRLGSGPFTPRNLTMAPRAGSWRAAPSWGSATHPGNLGGWVRALDNDTGPVALHPGLLTRRGWYLLDDSHDAVLTHRAPGFAARPAEDGYQDGYLFGYGRDFRTALRDLRTLAGPAPLLPRTAFGVWFSRYYPYSGSDYHRLLHTFRKHRVPLDTLSIDTDWKRQPSPLSAVLAGSVVGSHRA